MKRWLVAGGIVVLASVAWLAAGQRLQLILGGAATLPMLNSGYSLQNRLQQYDF